MEINKNECQYCKKVFKKDIYLTKHQKNAKYCVIIQKQIAEQEVEKSIQNLQTVKEEINVEIQDLINVNGDLIESNSTELQKKKIDEIHSIYLEFENDKICIENEYNLEVSKVLNKGGIKNNLEEYYNLEKIKISKIQSIYTEFENKKIEIQNKYDSIILEEILYEEEERFKDKKDTWKESFKDLKIKELENVFEIIKTKTIQLINDIKDVKNIDEIYNNNIFKINELLNLDIDENKVRKELEKDVIIEENSIISKDSSSNIYDTNSENSNSNKKKKQKIKRENEDTENNLLYHLILLLQDQKISNNTLMYIIIELMKHMNNYSIKGKDKKECILFILKNFVNTNNRDISNKEDILLFIDKFLDNFIDIISLISDKKIRIKIKRNCFLPICF